MASTHSTPSANTPPDTTEYRAALREFGGEALEKYMVKWIVELPGPDYPRNGSFSIEDSRQIEELEIILDEDLLLEQRLATFGGLMDCQDAMIQTWKDFGCYACVDCDFQKVHPIYRNEEETKQFRAAKKVGKMLRGKKAKSAVMLWCDQCTFTYPGDCEAPSCKDKAGCDRHHFPHSDCFSSYWDAAAYGIEQNVARGLLSELMASALRMLMKCNRFSKSYSAVEAFGNFLGVCVLPSTIAARSSDKMISRGMAFALRALLKVSGDLGREQEMMEALVTLWVVCAQEATKTQDGEVSTQEGES